MINDSKKPLVFITSNLKDVPIQNKVSGPNLVTFILIEDL